MRYFSGFSLQNEKALFSKYLSDGELTVAGFSYGAQKAFEYAYSSKERVDRLILLSPAFFQNQKPSFIRTQLRYFESGKDAYVKQFLANIAYPSSVDLSSYLNIGTKDELEELLKYVWFQEKIAKLISRGTTIEVFLGQKDKIVDVVKAQEFFVKECVTYTIKDRGHIL